MGRLTVGDVIHINFAEEHERRETEQLHDELVNALDDILDEGEGSYLFTTETGDEYLFELDNTPQLDWDGALTPEDFPLPETEKTLFGWSVRVYDHVMKSWYTQPDFYRSEDSALCRAEMYLMAIDFNPFNDNGGRYV